MKHDLETIKDTFSLSEVPRDALLIGAAGVIPYAATSLSTVYLAFDINHSHSHGIGYLFSPETAHQLLALVTPVQIGYGAVVRRDPYSSLLCTHYGRSSLSWEQSIGAWNSPSMVVAIATVDTLSGLLLLL